MTTKIEFPVPATPIAEGRIEPMAREWRRHFYEVEKVLRQDITGLFVPTGTGFRHITAGHEDAAAKLVENADVHASAAIAESKLALAYSTAALNTAIAGKENAGVAAGLIASHAALTASVHGFDASGNAPAQTHGNERHSSTFLTSADLAAYAFDNAVVHLAGDETITGVKTFTNGLFTQGIAQTSGVNGLFQNKREDCNNMMQFVPCTGSTGGTEWWLTSSQHYGGDAGLIGVAGNFYLWNQGNTRIEWGVSASTGGLYSRALVAGTGKIVQSNAGWMETNASAVSDLQLRSEKDQNSGYVGRAADGSVTLPGSTTASTLRIGNFEVQSFGANNVWYGDNMYFDGAKFVRRYAGYASAWYSLAGEMQLRMAPTGAAGSEVLTGGVTAIKASSTGAIAFPYAVTCSDYLELTEIATPASPADTAIRLYAEDFHGFSQLLYVDSTGMTRCLARDAVYVGRNTTGTTITAGKVVYARTSPTGNIPSLGLAKADSTSTMQAIGITIESIADSAFGRYMPVGILVNIDTSAFLEGEPLYVSATTAGELTDLAPTYPNIRQEMGTVLVSGVGNGSMQVVARSAFNESLYGISYLGLLDKPTSMTPTAHQLDGALHTVSGLTAGHFLKATSATAFGFAAHGLGYADVGACSTSDARLSDARTPTAHATSHKQGGSDLLHATDFSTEASDMDKYLHTNAATGVLEWVAGAGAVSSVFTRTGPVVAATNDYTWAQINKATSSIADITTLSLGARVASLVNSGDNNVNVGCIGGGNLSLLTNNTTRLYFTPAGAAIWNGMTASRALRLGSSSELAVATGDFSTTGGANTIPQADANGTIKTTSSAWYSQVIGGTGGTDVVVAGNLLGYATIAGHPSTLDAWDDLAINCRPDTGAGGLTYFNSLRVCGVTASRAALFDASKNLVSAAAPIGYYGTSPVSITDASTWYNATTFNISAGTWLVHMYATIVATGAQQITYRLYNLDDSIEYLERIVYVSGYDQTIDAQAVITVSDIDTICLQVQSTSAGAATATRWGYSAVQVA